ERKRVNDLLSLADSLKETVADRALSHAFEAEQICKESGLNDMLPRVYVVAGNLFKHKSDYPEALSKLMLAISLYEDMEIETASEKSLILEYGDCLNSVGEVYFILGRNDKAKEYLNASLDVYQKLNNKSRLAKSTINLGSIYYNSEEYELALETYLGVLEYYNQSDEAERIQTLYMNIGVTYFTMEKPEEGFHYFNLAEAECFRAIELNPAKSSFKKVLSNIYYSKAHYFYSVRNDKETFADYLHKSIDVLDNLYTIESVSPLLNLHELNSNDGDFEQAYKYLILLQGINDSLFNAEKATQINELESRYAIYKEQQEHELRERKTEVKYWMVLSGMLFLVIIILIIMNRQRNRARKAEMEKQSLMIKSIGLEYQVSEKDEILIKKEEELKRLANKIIEKNRSIGNLQSHVNKINTSLMGNVKHLKITDYIGNTRKSIEIEKDRKELLLSIEQISAPFFEKLDREFGRLTKYQKQLAALVKYDFTAKEISVIFNISHKAAQIAKYRLKKKLNLSAEQDLEEFLVDY
ncbi:MAG: tetratricopeptide repeat protein, partial [Bacteroidales bacterium]|nr:tetratricopeptide repeat protein [Bacteroidales bacterium]